jgi:Major Facilitator Superfamily
MDDSAEPNWRRWYALLVLTIVYASNIADRYVISTLIEPIRLEFRLSDSAVGFLTGTALAIFYTGLGLPLGLIADRVDRRKLVAFSMAVWSVMTAACGMTRSFTGLLISRIGVGIGEAGGTPASQSIIADLFPFSERALAYSIFALGAALGSMLGAVAGGAIAQDFGWRAAFLALGIPGVALALVVRLDSHRSTCTLDPGNSSFHSQSTVFDACFGWPDRGDLLVLGTFVVDARFFGPLAWIHNGRCGRTSRLHQWHLRNSRDSCRWRRDSETWAQRPSLAIMDRSRGDIRQHVRINWPLCDRIAQRSNRSSVAIRPGRVRQSRSYLQLDTELGPAADAGSVLCNHAFWRQRCQSCARATNHRIHQRFADALYRRWE